MGWVIQYSRLITGSCISFIEALEYGMTMKRVYLELTPDAARFSVFFAREILLDTFKIKIFIISYYL